MFQATPWLRPETGEAALPCHPDREVVGARGGYEAPTIGRSSSGGLCGVLDRGCRAVPPRRPVDVHTAAPSPDPNDVTGTRLASPGARRDPHSDVSGWVGRDQPASRKPARV